MASQKSKSIKLDLEALTDISAGAVLLALRQGLIQLFTYTYSGNSGLKKTLAEEALAKALNDKITKLDNETHRLMATGLYSLITLQPKPKGFIDSKWQQFTRQYRTSIARQTSPAMQKVRLWLARNGYSSYRDYIKDRAYFNKLNAITLRRAVAQGEVLQTPYTRYNRKATSTRELIANIKAQLAQGVGPKYAELLNRRILNLRKRQSKLIWFGRSGLVTGPYGYQSGEFASKFLSMPVKLKLSLGGSRQTVRAQIRVVVKSLQAANAAAVANAGKSLDREELSEKLSPKLSLEWEAPKRLEPYMRRLLFDAKYRFVRGNFPMFDESYAAAALESAINETFGLSD